MRHHLNDMQQVAIKHKVTSTLPEANSSPLKIGHPKRKVAFQPSIFTGRTVSFRECKIGWVVPPPSNSHHQDYYIFQPKPSFATGILGGGTTQKIASSLEISMSPILPEKVDPPNTPFFQACRVAGANLKMSWSMAPNLVVQIASRFWTKSSETNSYMLMW